MRLAAPLPSERRQSAPTLRPSRGVLIPDTDTSGLKKDTEARIRVASCGQVVWAEKARPKAGNGICWFRVH